MNSCKVPIQILKVHHMDTNIETNWNGASLGEVRTAMRGALFIQYLYAK